MKTLNIQFTNTMVLDDAILIEAGNNEASFIGVTSLTGVIGEFEIGSSATESATNLQASISNYSAVTGSFGPTHVERSGDTISITFIDESITTASAEYLGTVTKISTSLSDRLNSYYNYDRQILSRSPHYYYVEALDGGYLDYAELHIFIYQGSRYTERPFSPTYVVRSSALLANTDKMSFNISEFARSFSEGTLAQSGNEANWTPFMDIFPYYTQDGITYSLPPSFGIAYNGYGYFEEGVNPTNDSAISQSNKTIIANNGFSIPINAEKTSRVLFEKDGEVVKIQNVSSDVTYSTSALPFVSNNNIPIETDRRLNGDYFDNLYLSEYQNMFGNTEADTIYVERTDGDTEVVKVRYIQECKYDPIKLTFVNKFGALQSVWFFKNHSVSMKVDQDSFRRNTLNGVNILGINEGEFSTTQHQHKNLYKSGKQSISLNSGFYPEEYNEVFRQMMLSTDCWIDYNAQVVPVNISDSDISYKTSINDKLIEYSIKCDFAYDTINSIN
jgi:hypothetical protein